MVRRNRRRSDGKATQERQARGKQPSRPLLMSSSEGAGAGEIRGRAYADCSTGTQEARCAVFVNPDRGHGAASGVEPRQEGREGLANNRAPYVEKSPARSGGNAMPPVYKDEAKKLRLDHRGRVLDRLWVDGKLTPRNARLAPTTPEMLDVAGPRASKPPNPKCASLRRDQRQVDAGREHQAGGVRQIPAHDGPEHPAALWVRRERGREAGLRSRRGPRHLIW